MLPEKVLTTSPFKNIFYVPFLACKGETLLLRERLLIQSLFAVRRIHDVLCR